MDMAKETKAHEDARETPHAKATNVTREDERFIDEHEDQPGQSLATRAHEVIQAWAEDKERQGTPATVPGTEHEGRPGVLRIDFPGRSGSNLEHIGWDDWFKSFDERELVFVYQEHKKDGHPSTFFRLDNPEREDG